MSTPLTWDAELPLSWDAEGLTWDDDVLEPPTPTNPPMPDPNNTVSAVITPEILTAVLAKYDAIETELTTVLTTLSEQERRRRLRVGTTVPPFDQSADQAMRTKPQFTPSYVNAAETRKDVALFAPLGEIFQRHKTLERRYLDTFLQAGHEFRKAHLAYYGQAQDAAEHGVADAQAVVDLLAPLLPQNNRDPETPDEPPAEEDGDPQTPPPTP